MNEGVGVVPSVPLTFPLRAKGGQSDKKWGLLVGKAATIKIELTREGGVTMEGGVTGAAGLKGGVAPGSIVQGSTAQGSTALALGTGAGAEDGVGGSITGAFSGDFSGEFGFWAAKQGQINPSWKRRYFVCKCECGGGAVDASR
jgi:hypothetical protein